MKILFIIPARGGSKGIPRKNVRILNGKPLIYYSITTAKNCKYEANVVVSTDDMEIGSVSQNYGADVIIRPNELSTDNVTLDPVISHCVEKYEKTQNCKFDIVVTLQPTSPLLTVHTLNEALDTFIDKGYDTMISGINNPHLAWSEKDGVYYPLYEERKNRQELPKYLSETGAFVITKREFVTNNSRFGKKLTVYEVPQEESVDIDTYRDWYIADRELCKKNILIRVDGYSKIGMGHIYRCLQIAYSMPDHNVRFVLNEKSDLGIKKIKASFYPFDIIRSNDEILNLINEHQTNIVINDILDTEDDYIKTLNNKGVRVVNFEDLGEGSKKANATINALYEKKLEGNKYYWGSEYYCMRDEFLLTKPSDFNNEVKQILILFGGTDPSNLSLKLLNIVKHLPYKIKYTFIVGTGYDKFEELNRLAGESLNNVEVIQNVSRMADYMRKADFAISSQGRTMFELASFAVPTIILAQNERELHHEFGYLKNGFINLGLGKEIEDKTIQNTLIWLINCPEIRRQMRGEMLKKDFSQGLNRVKKIILGENEE